MSVSDKVKCVLTLCGKKQLELAEYFGMSKQAMSNKMARESWSATDLAKVAKFTGCKLFFEMPDGQRIYIDSANSKKE